MGVEQSNWLSADVIQRVRERLRNRDHRHVARVEVQIFPVTERRSCPAPRATSGSIDNDNAVGRL